MVDERTRRAAPWCFEPVAAKAPIPEASGAGSGPALFESLIDMDRKNDAAARSNQAARLSTAAQQHGRAALQLRGLRADTDPVAVCLRVAELMGYDTEEDDDGEGKPDPVGYVDRRLDEVFQALRNLTSQWEAAENRCQEKDRELEALRHERHALKQQLAEVAERAPAKKKRGDGE